MKRRSLLLGLGALLGVLALVAAACAPAPEPTAAPPQATTAPAEPVATTAPVAPVATEAAMAPTVAVAEEVKVRPIPVVQMPAANPKAKHGGIFRKLSSVDPPDFGIWDSANGVTFEVAVMTTDSLLDRNEYEADKNDQLLANVAYDFWINETGDRWTFKLVEAKFTDGVPFTCADAKFSLDTLRLGRDSTGDELRRSPRGVFLSRVTETRCPDDRTLEISTDGPLPSLPATLAISSFAMMPKHIFEGHLDLLERPLEVGMGPYIFSEYRPTEYVRFRRNPGYWNQPFPYLDGYDVIYLGSTAATQAAMRVGRGEGGVSFPPALRDQLEKEGKIYVQGRIASDGFLGYQANWTRTPWKDPRFSLAMRCALDSRKLIDTVSSGEGFEGPIFPLATDPGGSEWAITEAEWAAIHPCHGRSGSKENMEKRQEIARGLMKEMGFGPDNLAKPTSYRGATDEAWVSIREDFAKVYIYPEIKTVTVGLQYEIQTSGGTDILQQGFVTSRRDPDHWLLEHYYSTSDRNYGRYANAEVDALMQLQSRTLDKVERKRIINQIEKILLKDNAKLVTRHSFSARVYAPWVRDVWWGEPGNSQNTSVKYVRTWIDPAIKKSMGY